MTNPIEDLAYSEVILAVGTNTTEAHPVIFHRIREALTRRDCGSRLIVIDPRPTEMARRADLWLQPLPGSNVALLGALAGVIVDEGLANDEFIRNRTENFEAFRVSLADFSPEEAERISGVPAEMIRSAARMYGSTRQGSIVYAMGVTQHSSGTDGVLALANLALLTGNVGRRGCGVYPLRGQNNVQGACDAGALPNYRPGYQPLGDRPMSGRPGLTLVEMNQAAREGRLKAMWVMGENPALSDPDSGEARRGLEGLEFLAVSDLFPTETALLADVVFPAAAFAEKDGTFTNTERRVQLVRKAVDPPGEARSDLETIIGVMTRLGLNPPADSADVFDELARAAPILAGISHRRLQAPEAVAGIQWPCPSPDHPGTAVLHQDRFSRGKGRFHPVAHRLTPEQPDGKFPLILTTGRNLYQYHTGSLSRRSELAVVRGEPYVEISAELAAEKGISSGDRVRLVGRRGSLELSAAVVEGLVRNVVFVPFHYAEAAANRLTGEALDPISKMPELKVTPVRLECIISG